MAVTKVLLAGLDAFDPKAVILPVKIPTGYRRVWRGALVQGDLYLHALKALAGEIVWATVEPQFLGGSKERSAYKLADDYACVVRPGGADVDHPCERCEVEPRRVGNRYCRACCAVVSRRL